MPAAGTFGGGEMVLIDYENFREIDHKRFTSPSLSTMGQVSATNNEVVLDTSKSRYGRYTTPYPIWEQGGGNRFLASWALCRLTDDPDLIPDSERRLSCKNDANFNDDTLVEAEPFYGLYMYNRESNLKRPIVLPDEGMAVVNPVAIITRPVDERPPVIPNKNVADGTLDADSLGRDAGVLIIKSVYDTLGAQDPMVDSPLSPSGGNIFLNTESVPTTTVYMDPVTGAVSNNSGPNLVPRVVADIPTIRDPAQTSADERVARFVRVSMGVPRVQDVNEMNLNGNDFGNANFMRQILGYQEVEPDGSVYMEVPAQVPLAIEVLDGEGRALVAHNNWIQLMPGEVKVCNGCHSPDDGQHPINQGSLTGTPFPNTVNTFLQPELGETMAELRKRTNCLGQGCDYPFLKLGLIYQDVWTDPSIRTPDTAFAYEYDMADANRPVPATCDPTSTAAGTWEWTAANKACRIIINFAVHIQPIFDNKCISCHTSAGGTQVPAGHLNLDTSDTDPFRQVVVGNNGTRLVTYDLLFQGDRRTMEINTDGQLQFRVVRDAMGNAIDVDGLILNETDPNDFQNLQFLDDARPSLMSSGVARARNSHLIEVLFNEELRAGGTVNTAEDHSVRLTDGERKLIIEWIDNGGQYLNDLSIARNN
jgi:hypothetical protein